MDAARPRARGRQTRDFRQVRDLINDSAPAKQLREDRNNPNFASRRARRGLGRTTRCLTALFCSILYGSDYSHRLKSKRYSHCMAHYLTKEIGTFAQAGPR